MTLPKNDLLRRLIYASEATHELNDDLPGILRTSQTNNGLDGITGLLWTDGRHYVQVIEGAAEAVDAVLARICVDARHHNLQILSDLTVERRAFTYWSMVGMHSAVASSSEDERLRRAIQGAPGDVQAALGERLRRE